MRFDRLSKRRSALYQADRKGVGVVSCIISGSLMYIYLQARQRGGPHGPWGPMVPGDPLMNSHYDYPMDYDEVVELFPVSS